MLSFRFRGVMFAGLSSASFSDSILDAAAVNAEVIMQSKRNTTRFLKLIIVAWMTTAVMIQEESSMVEVHRLSMTISYDRR